MSKLSSALVLIRWSGPAHVLKILRYTLFRDRLDREYLKSESTPKRSIAQRPGKLSQVGPLPNGARFQFEGAKLEVAYLAPDLVRCSWEPGILPVPYALAKTDWLIPEVSLSQVSEGWLLASKDVQILVAFDGSLKFFDQNGIMIREEFPPSFQGEQEDTTWTNQVHIRPDEHLYGLGEQASRLNLLGCKHSFWNHDPGGSYKPGNDPIYMPNPVYMSLHQEGSYLVFYENSFPGTFNSDLHQDHSSVVPQTASITFESGMLRYYFIPGPPARALERFTELTGRAELPPLWSLGYHQSRWGYKNEFDIREAVDGFLQHHMPLSAIHLDINYMDGYRVFTVDQDRFPDLAALCRDLYDLGIRLVVILDCGVKVDLDYSLYKEGLREGVFCTLPDGKPLVGVVWPGRSVFPDFTSPKARAWWGAQYPRMLESGIAGFKHDMNEPTSFTAWGNKSLPIMTQHSLEGRGGDHRQAHNLYALLMNRSAFESLRKYRPEKRPWILSRSGWVSQQRFAWKWTGDSATSWENLRLTIATVLGTGLSGHPFTGPDIGGFSGNPTAELYLRWFQLAAFLPFFRTHSAIGTLRREPWVFGEPYTSIIRQYIRLRYNLLPYFYTLAWEASRYGYPLVRPLFWVDATDRELWGVDDAFLLGDNLLIAPILEEGQKHRPVVLPQGDWYSLWDEVVFHGPGEITLEATLEQIPILVRAGSILLMKEGERLQFHVYPPEGHNDISSQYLFSDAGDGYGDWRLDHFHLSRNRHSLDISREYEGNFPFPYNQVELQFHGLQAVKAWVDGQQTPIEENKIQTGIFRNVHIEA